MGLTIIRKRAFNLNVENKNWIVYTIGLICLFLFSISAYSKIVDHERFVSGLSTVKYIGQYASFISWAVPIAEIIVSLLLLIPQTTRLGLYGFTGLMMVFTLYIAIMINWADKIPCYCNLIVEKLSWVEHLWFNIGFIGLAIFALWLGIAKNNKT